MLYALTQLANYICVSNSVDLQPTPEQLRAEAQKLIEESRRLIAKSAELLLLADEIARQVETNRPVDRPLDQRTAGLERTARLREYAARYLPSGAIPARVRRYHATSPLIRLSPLGGEDHEFHDQ